MLILSLISLFWITCVITVYLWKKELFQSTWQEPYFKESLVLIESDDWGPGGKFHAERLKIVLAHLKEHKDSTGRAAVLTADVVLALPDIGEIVKEASHSYKRRFLDQAFPEIYQAMQQGISDGTLVPQLHGLEHLNGKAFYRLFEKNDCRVEKAFQETGWWDWESLDSPLQGHYVDGSQLPTKPLKTEEIKETVEMASAQFEKIFGHTSSSSVAPCYLWDDDVETAWFHQGVGYIQTAGYRCTGRDQKGDYIQNPQLIRVGNKSHMGQIYLVRNVMYEPVDGEHSSKSAYDEALQALQQALPITVSTHRYNYTRSKTEFNDSLSGLDQLLRKIGQNFPATRFLSSPELGDAIKNRNDEVTNYFNQSNWPPLTRLTGVCKLSAFLQRLRYRHPKLCLMAKLSGLALPAMLIIWVGRRNLNLSVQ